MIILHAFQYVKQEKVIHLSPREISRLDLIKSISDGVVSIKLF